MSINTISNANVYLDGTGDLIGKVERVTLPDIEPTMEAMAGLGMVSEFDVPTGLKKMVIKLAWKSFYPDALKHRLDFHKTTAIQIRGNLETYDQTGRVSEEPAVVLASVQFSKTTLGAIERAKPIGSMEDEMQVYRLELKIGSTTHLKYDLFSNVYEVNGVDKFAQMRSNQGRA